jgi:hypothetical protein
LIVELGEPRVDINDKLRSDIEPIMAQATSADHRPHKGVNNATEVSHRPTRKREKMFERLKDLRRVATRYDRSLKCLLLRQRSRGNRHILVMCPEPKLLEVCSTDGGRVTPSQKTLHESRHQRCQFDVGLYLATVGALLNEQLTGSRLYNPNSTKILNSANFSEPNYLIHY